MLQSLYHIVVLSLLFASSSSTQFNSLHRHNAQTSLQIINRGGSSSPPPTSPSTSKWFSSNTALSLSPSKPNPFKLKFSINHLLKIKQSLLPHLQNIQPPPLFPFIAGYLLFTLVKEFTLALKAARNELEGGGFDTKVFASSEDELIRKLTGSSPPPSPISPIKPTSATTIDRKARFLEYFNLPQPPSPAPPKPLSPDERYRKILRSLTRPEYDLLKSCIYTPPPPTSTSATNGMAASSPSISMLNDDPAIGGLTYIRESLQQIIAPFLTSSPTISHSKSKKSYGNLLQPPKGVLLYGPPGCGKTLLFKSLAKHASLISKTNGSRERGVLFLVVTPGTFLRKFIGETSLQVRSLFSLIRKLQPCVIFVDEIDSLFHARGSASSEGGGEHEVYRDLKTEFMQQWDGLHNEPNEQILIVGASNRPFDIDPAINRRMARSFLVGFPDIDGRVDILRKMLRDVPLERGFDYKTIATRTEGFSGSDLKELCRFGALIVQKESLSLSNNLGSGDEMRAMRTSDILKAIERGMPTHVSSMSYKDKLRKYEEGLENGFSSEINGDSNGFGDGDDDEDEDDVSSSDESEDR